MGGGGWKQSCLGSYLGARLFFSYRALLKKERGRRVKVDGARDYFFLIHLERARLKEEMERGTSGPNDGYKEFYF